MADLTYLGLPFNQLSGEVPVALSNLTLSYMVLQGQTGRLTAATPTLAAWLASFDRGWNDGCPGFDPSLDPVGVGL